MYNSALFKLPTSVQTLSDGRAVESPGLSRQWSIRILILDVPSGLDPSIFSFSVRNFYFGSTSLAASSEVLKLAVFSLFRSKFWPFTFGSPSRFQVETMRDAWQDGSLQWNWTKLLKVPTCNLTWSNLLSLLEDTMFLSPPICSMLQHWPLLSKANFQAATILPG